jgi:sugar lactone lactonase YvrE
VTARALGLLAALAVAAGVGCAGPGAIAPTELPDSPIAMLWRSEALALDRVDALRDLEKRQAGLAREGVAQIEDLDAWLGGRPDLERRLRPLQGQLVLLDPRRGERTSVEGAPAAARPLAWSADHTRLLLAARWRDATQLFVWDRASDSAEIVTAGSEEHPTGCFAADGRVVAVELDPAARTARLVAWPAGGGTPQRLTEGPWHVQPACSSADPKVAFVALDATGTPQVAVIDLEAPGPPRAVARGHAPAFTPDGAWILYVARTAAGQRLWRVRADGAGRTPVGAGTVEEQDPTVSPDGRYVAYVAVGEDRRERLRVRRFDGSGDRPLVGEGDAAWPVW